MIYGEKGRKGETVYNYRWTLIYRNQDLTKEDTATKGYIEVEEQSSVRAIGVLNLLNLMKELYGQKIELRNQEVRLSSSPSSYQRH